MKIRFTVTGRNQFLKAIQYIKLDNLAAAHKFRKRAEKALRRLEQFPESGRRIPEFPTLQYRELILPPYRFFYRLDKKIVWVVAVWHEAQIADLGT